MVIKHICDECGSEHGVGRFVIDYAISTPHDKPVDLPKYDRDLCAKCYKMRMNEFRNFLIRLSEKATVT